MKHLRRFRCWVRGHHWEDRRWDDFWGAFVYDCHRCRRVAMRWFD